MTERVGFRYIKPYYAPDSPADLHGSYSGKIKLRLVVLWAPGDGVVGIDDQGELHLAYQAPFAEGLVKDQAEGLNAHRLREKWPDLRIDRRVRQLWEERFHELRSRQWIVPISAGVATTAHTYQHGKSAVSPWRKGLDDLGRVYVYCEFNLVNIHAAFWPGRL